MVFLSQGGAHSEGSPMFRLHAQSVRWTAIAVVVIAGCTTVPATTFGVALPGYTAPLSQGSMLNVRLDGTTAADAGSYHSKIAIDGATPGTFVNEDAGDFTLTTDPNAFCQKDVDTSGLGSGDYTLYVYKDTYTGEGSGNEVPVAKAGFKVKSDYSY